MNPSGVILDRDGVINVDSPHFIRSLDEWQPLPGSIDAIARLSQAGFRVAICTNQSGVGRGLFGEDVVHAIHGELQRQVEAAGGNIAGFFFCPHAPGAGCDCRKPKPGLLVQAGAALDLSLQGMPVIGDSLRDLEAGQRVGGQPILVRTGKGEATLADGVPAGTVICKDLAEAACYLLGP